VFAALVVSNRMATIEILPGIGLSNIQFGLRKNELITYLGEPDKSFKTDSGCERLQYNELMIEVSIEPENENKFGWVEVYNPDFTFYGEKLIGKSKEIVISKVTEFLNEEPNIDDYGSFESYDFENNWVELQFSFNKLNCINIGVFISESDELLWPNN